MKSMPRHKSRVTDINHAAGSHEPLIAAAIQQQTTQHGSHQTAQHQTTPRMWGLRSPGDGSMMDTLHRWSVAQLQKLKSTTCNLCTVHPAASSPPPKRKPKMSFSQTRRPGASPNKKPPVTEDVPPAQESPNDAAAKNGNNTSEVSGSPDARRGSSPNRRSSYLGASFNVDQEALARELQHFHDEAQKTHVDIVQMSSPLYFVEEDERKLQVDIMRLGNLQGKCKVEYFTEDGSAKAGERYKAAEGKVVFKEGEHTKPVDLWVLNNDTWATTLEFKIHLRNAEGCEIGPYLHGARIKIIDNDTFPSSKYEHDLLDGEEGIERIAAWKLFLEYIKLNLKTDGIAPRTVLILLLDQLHNMYKFLLLKIQIYLVDVLFNLQEAEESNKEMWIKMGPENGRIYTAQLIAVLYIVPMLFLHMWDVQKVYLDLGGLSREYLQLNLFRKYLNFSDESRQKVPYSHMQVAIVRDCDEVAGGYMSLLQLMQIVGKLIIVTSFILSENPAALTSVLLMPALMSVFVYFRINDVISLTELNAERLAEVVDVTSEACSKYGLIADYQQRPQILDLFSERCHHMTEARLPMEREQLNNNYATKWLGPIFTGVYIAMNAKEVLTPGGKLPLGVFLATITVFRELTENFEGAYEQLMDVFEAFGPLKKLTLYLNADTDLKRWKEMNRRRRELTKVSTLEVLKGGGDEVVDAPESKGKIDKAKGEKDKKRKNTKAGKDKNLAPRFKTDLIPLSVRGMNFRYKEGPYILRNVNADLPQGTLVAVVGEHGCGKSTLLRLLGHNIFPTEGQIFIPTHLRIVHVAKEPSILNLSAWANLTFGRHQAIPKRVGLILKDMNMLSTLDLIREELRDMGREHELHYDDIIASHKEIEEESGSGTELESESDVESSDTDISELRNETEVEGKVPWQEKLSYTEKHKLQLARALVSNPEILVLHKPVANYDTRTATNVMRIIKEHVRNRGFHVSSHTVARRRPRTCIFTPSNEDQMKMADRVWLCADSKVRDWTPEDLLTEKHRKRLRFFDDDEKLL